MGVDDRQDDEVMMMAKSNLSLALFQEIFGKIEPEVTIVSFEEEPGSSRGDNYTAALYRIQLFGHLVAAAKENKKIKWQKQIICKKLPESQARKDAYRCESLFLNEVKFYNKILPALLDFEKTKTTERCFRNIPDCFLARSNLLILDDLCAKQFKMPVRQEGLSLQQTQQILVVLARFHALSLAFKAEHPEKFSKLAQEIEEGIFSHQNYDWYQNYYKGLTEDAVEMVDRHMEEQKVEKREMYSEKMRKFVNVNIFKEMIKLVEFESPLSVICHGDCWVNNFLFRDNQGVEGNSKVAFVDFQLIRVSSLTLDIANLLFCCTDRQLRADHLNHLIHTYAQELFAAMKKFGPIPARICGQSEMELEEKIWIDFKKTAKFGLGLAMDIIPISTCSSEEAPDLYYLPTEERSGAPNLNIVANELCRRKMTGIVMDLVDLELL